jgi:hypothetical protein
VFATHEIPKEVCDSSTFASVAGQFTASDSDGFNLILAHSMRRNGMVEGCVRVPLDNCTVLTSLFLESCFCFEG